jgi:polar amino acid transport system permease protein
MPPPAEVIRAIPVRHPFRAAFAGLLSLLVVAFLIQMAGNPHYHWDVVTAYFTSWSIIEGLWRTIQLTVSAMSFGICLGLVLAMMRLSPNRVLFYITSLFVWFFRGTPLIVQIIFWFNLSTLYPNISLPIPFDPYFIQLDMNVIITPWAAAILALSLHEAAYMAEIIRGGILSVDDGQTEAATALGMRRVTTMRRIVLPQAMRAIVPPMGNNFISMLKTTSLVSVIALPELLYSAEIIYGRNFQTIPLLIVASLWYLIVTSVLTIGQYYIERYSNR